MEPEEGKENPLIRFLETIADMAILGVLWVVCSLPLITLGAATVSCYRAGGILSERKHSISAVFFGTFREVFRQATLAELLLLAFGGVLWLDWRIVRGMESALAAGVSAAVIVLAAVWFLVVLAVFPLMSRYDNTLGQHLRNAAALVLLNLPRCVVLLIFSLLPVIAFVLNPQMFFGAALPIVLVFWPGCYFWGSAYLFRKMFLRFENAPVSGEEKDG